MKSGIRIVVVAALGAVVAGASAQTIGSFALNHGGSSYGEQNLIGAGTATNAGLADFRLGAAPDHLFQNWWWYNTNQLTREYALGNQVSGSSSGNHARIVYTESGGPSLPNALLFDLEYTLTQVSSELAVVQIGWKVHNLSNTTLAVNFFSYTDFDLNNTGGDDSGLFIAPNQMQISDASAYQAGLIASSTGLVGWEQGPYASIRNKLTNASLDNLANATTPFGPGDWTGAFQWNFTLAANGTSGGADQRVGSLVKYVAVPEPASMLALAAGVGVLLRRRRRA